MPVTEFAILTLPSPSPPSPHLLSILHTAKHQMKTSSSHPFTLLSSITDPTKIYILGTWPSVSYHMTTWLPSAENQDLLKRLEGLVEVECMFHIGAVGVVELVSAAECKEGEGEGKEKGVVCIERFHVLEAGKGGFERKLQEFRGLRLGEHGVSVEGEVCGGWRVDGVSKGEAEFVLFTVGEGGKADDEEFVVGDGDKVDGWLEAVCERVDVKYARMLNVGGGNA